MKEILEVCKDMLLITLCIAGIIVIIDIIFNVISEMIYRGLKQKKIRQNIEKVLKELEEETKKVQKVSKSKKVQKVSDNKKTKKVQKV